MDKKRLFFYFFLMERDEKVFGIIIVYDGIFIMSLVFGVFLVFNGLFS